MHSAKSRAILRRQMYSILPLGYDVLSVRDGTVLRNVPLKQAVISVDRNHRLWARHRELTAESVFSDYHIVRADGMPLEEVEYANISGIWNSL